MQPLSQSTSQSTSVTLLGNQLRLTLRPNVLHFVLFARDGTLDFKSFPVQYTVFEMFLEWRRQLALFLLFVDQPRTF
jgi:hypothetical protein